MGEGLSIIDVHAHILPGLDDGPQGVDEALRMCEQSIAQGVFTVVATPHMCDPRYSVSAEDVRSKVAELSEACEKRALDIKILPGADVRLQPNLPDLLQTGEALTIADTGRYFLLELPSQIVPHIGSLVFELQIHGLIPILTHPERNLDFCRRPERLAALVQSGCLVQITGDSLLGRFGRTVLKAAKEMIQSNLAHVVASDTHSANDRRPALGRVAETLGAMFEEETARMLLCENPKRIIRGEPVWTLENGFGIRSGVSELRCKKS